MEEAIDEMEDAQTAIDEITEFLSDGGNLDVNKKFEYIIKSLSNAISC